MRDRANRQAATGEVELESGVLGSFIGYGLKRAYLNFQSDFIDSVAHLGLRPGQFAALSIIIDNPDISQSRLARALEIERSGVVLIVDDLEGRDLISRNKVPGDRRSYALRATSQGEALRDEAVVVIGRHEDRLLANLSATERKTLQGLLARLL
jgi:DNA-binding MarR family transcriptional regulator